MNSKKYKKTITSVLLAIILFLMLSLFYIIVYGNKMGVMVSCKDLQIIDIKRIPPPLMTALPPPIECIIDLKVVSQDREICKYEKYEIRESIKVISCKDLDKEVKKSDITIEATFYSADGSSILSKSTKTFTKRQS